MLRPRRASAVFAIPVAALIAGCGVVDSDDFGTILRSGKSRESAPAVPKTELATHVKGNTSFAADMYKELRAKPGNLFFSPHSISTAVGMLHAGARGNTEKQIAKAMHFVAQSDLHPAANALDLALNSRGKNAKGKDGEPFRLNVVNATWGQRNYTFVPSYLDTLAVNYGAGVRILDFAADPEAARGTINKWVESKTEDRIKTLLPQGSITGLTRLVLTNAVYFNASWANPFDKSKTKAKPFTLLDGKRVDVQTMHQTKTSRYGKGKGFEVADLAYDGGELSMMVIVPDAGTFAAYEKALSAKAIDDAHAALSTHLLDLALPSFGFKGDYDLVPPLKRLGVDDVFSPGTADLSGISGKRDLYVSAAVHKSFIKLDEAGTEAAAATGIVAGTTSAPMPASLTVDRPFIFLVRDRATGAIVFLGRVVDPR